MNISILGRLALALAILLGATAARAAGPVETSVFAVQGVAVDVTDTDASTAKNKALVEVQVKAFKMLAERLGSPEIVDAVTAMDTKQILPYLRSLSIEEEAISPGRYQGKLTVRFLPEKIKSLYASYGVRVVSAQGPSFLVLPIWKSEQGQQLWEDNPWHQAWSNLRAEQSLVPVIVPLGDLDDTEALTVQDVLSNDEVKLEAMRRRYDVSAILVVYAEPDGQGGVHASLNATTALGKIVFDKDYRADSGVLAESAALATQRFHDVMVEKYKSNADKQAARQGASQRQTLTVSVPFNGPSEWNGLRSRILATPGVVALDVSSLAGDGAVVRLTVSGDLNDLPGKFQSAGLGFSRAGGNWIIQAL
ncbi:MAG: DUF2066 domain-containing protein [Hyphomicrobiales bacterium]